mgnify:CR=1 FL=1
MNWFDFVLLAAFSVGTLYGLKIGLIKAMFLPVALYVGWMLAGQWSDDVGDIFAKSVSNDTIVTVLSYTVIMATSLVVSNYIVKIVKPPLTVVTLGLSGLVDRLGGLALGFVIGIALVGAIIVGSARLTYNISIDAFDNLLPETISGRIVQVGDQVASIEYVRTNLETALTQSEFASAFIDVADSLPGNTLGFIPSDFKISFDILKGQFK